MQTLTKETQNFATNILFNLLKEFGYHDIHDFQKKNSLTVDGQFGPKSFEKLYHSVLNVTDANFDGSFWKEEYNKKQIIWHHSVGWDNARQMFDIWKRDNYKHVCTSIGIVDSGNIVRGFNEKFWGSSIGCKNDVFKQYKIPYVYEGSYIANNRNLDKGAIAVEICNSGYLVKKGDDFYTTFGYKMPKDKIIQVSYRGQDYWERYTDNEIQSLKYWTLLMAMRFDIPLNYSHDDMWEVSYNALSGKPGLYTHNSYRIDKKDVIPQPHLVEMAKTLPLYMKPFK